MFYGTMLGILFKLLSSLQEHSIAKDIKCDTAHPEEWDPICMCSCRRE